MTHATHSGGNFKLLVSKKILSSNKRLYFKIAKGWNLLLKPKIRAHMIETCQQETESLDGSHGALTAKLSSHTVERAQSPNLQRPRASLKEWVTWNRAQGPRELQATRTPTATVSLEEKFGAVYSI